MAKRHRQKQQQTLNCNIPFYFKWIVQIITFKLWDKAQFKCNGLFYIDLVQLTFASILKQIYLPKNSVNSVSLDSVDCRFLRSILKIYWTRSNHTLITQSGLRRWKRRRWLDLRCYCDDDDDGGDDDDDGDDDDYDNVSFHVLYTWWSNHLFAVIREHFPNEHRPSRESENILRFADTCPP